MRADARDARVEELSRDIIDEILIAIGLPAQGGLRRLLEPLLWRPAEHFSRIAARFDQVVGQSGLCEAARKILPEFVSSFDVHGADQVPTQGPLIVASNHPGAYDGLVIAGGLQRPDLKMVISGVPFTQALRNARQSFIYATPNLQERMAVIRACIRHLESGGALLIFPSGVVDPDPAILPGAAQALQRWSRSLEIMLRKVPQTCLVPTIVGGVLDPKSLKNPLVRLQKDWQQRKLAEVLQLIQQMFFDRKYELVPKVTFGGPLSVGQMADDGCPPGVLPTIIESARQVLELSYSP